MEKLKCHVQTYAWGKKGLQSEVARIYMAGHQDASIDANTPYAEVKVFWKPTKGTECRTCRTATWCIRIPLI